MALSHFKVGSQSDYDSLQTKDNGTLYFIIDSGASRIYKGETLMATLNDDYIVDNTGNNITITINNNTHKISAEIGESIMSILNDIESEWGEIPYSGPIPILNDETEYRHYWAYDNGVTSDVFKYNDNEYYYIDQSERELHEFWTVGFTDKWILGSDLLPIQHVLYTGNLNNLDPASSSG